MANFTDEQVALHEFIFKRLQVNISQVFSLHEFETAVDRIEMAERLDNMFRGMIFDLRMYMAGDHTVTDVQYVRWPKTWWEAFKERWFSDKLLKHWPVQYETRKFQTQTITRMCPHLGFDPRDNKRKHLSWLMYDVPPLSGTRKDGSI